MVDLGKCFRICIGGKSFEDIADDYAAGNYTTALSHAAISSSRHVIGLLLDRAIADGQDVYLKISKDEMYASYYIDHIPKFLQLLEVADIQMVAMCDETALAENPLYQTLKGHPRFSTKIAADGPGSTFMVAGIGYRERRDPPRIDAIVCFNDPSATRRLSASLKEMTGSLPIAEPAMLDVVYD